MRAKRLKKSKKKIYNNTVNNFINNTFKLFIL